MKPGTKFEKLTSDVFSVLCKANVHEKVEHNVLLDGQDGPRQIDVLISGKVGPFDAKTIVECKDYSKKLDITVVDALHSKLIDVQAQKAVLVSRKGFTNRAIHKANRLGISLCTIHSMENEKWKFQSEIPIIITEYACEKITPSFEFIAISNNLDISKLVKVSDVSLFEVAAEYWKNNEIECDAQVKDFMLIPEITKPHWVYVPDGRKMEISELKINMHITRTYYYGYANNLKTARYIDYIEKDEKTVLFDPNELSNYRESMVKYVHYDDIPKVKDTLNIKVKVVHEK